MLLTLALVWGGSFFFAEIALTEVSALTIVLHRVFWAAPVALLILLWQGAQIPKGARVWLCFLVMGALNNAIPFSLIFWGQTTITTGLAAILNSTTAFFGAIVAGVLLADESLTPRKLIGALFGILGVASILGWGALTEFDIRNLAQLAVLGASLSYAFAGVWAKRHLSQYSPATNTFGMLVGSTLLVIPMALLVDGTPSFALSTKVWAALLALAIMSTAVAYLLYFKILARAGSANLMLVTLLIPPVTATLGATFLNESLGRDAVIGFVLIGVGLIITDVRLLRRLKLG